MIHDIEIFDLDELYEQQITEITYIYVEVEIELVCELDDVLIILLILILEM